jgi:NACHT domain
MRHEPSLTLRGALEILGKHEHPVIERFDRILGGVVLGSGAVAGLGAVGGVALAPLGLWAAIWGWTEQKDAALSLLRKALDSVSGKINGTAGYERRQLIGAAHTTIVAAAFWEAFRAAVTKDVSARLNITDKEKQTLLSGSRQRYEGKRLIDLLYAAEVPAPTPSRGFEENRHEVIKWMSNFAEAASEFIGGLRNGEKLYINWRKIVEMGADRYNSHFLTLAAQIPEFALWAMLNENAATRVRVQAANAELAEALSQTSAALARLEGLLALTAASSKAVPDLRAIVGRANQRILSEPIVATDENHYGPDITFETVSRMYINPLFRIARQETGARPADEHWWDNQHPRDEFDLMFAAYLTTPDATRLPMLLLGDPGAGKSLLTQVLAARLPVSGYTVVWVPLRRIAANAPLVEQVQQALDLTTSERVTWGRLSDQSLNTIRVVVLDGLDELLQASSTDRSGYLQEVMEFQRVEAAQERPVIVIVTSRIVVADRVEIPRGTTVVKLDGFSDQDIEDWLSRWHKANAVAVAAGKVRPLTLEAVLQQPELARQPLLLLMLALYTADPASPPLNSSMSTADLYQNLMGDFARREARKSLGPYAHGRDLDNHARAQLDRLAVAALAMFNRGKQSVSDDELGADLAALNKLPTGHSRPDGAGQHVIGEFFFVHSPQALLHVGGRQTRRSYEFLHATFGEYLVASHVMGELIDVTDKAFAGRRGLSDPQDDLLFALLSYQPLAARTSILSFAEEIGTRLSDDDWHRVLDVLEMLLESYRDRHSSDLYGNYRPTAWDSVRQLACYSANLVCLRLAMEPNRANVPLSELLRLPEGDDGLIQWRSMVRLWQAGLDTDGMQAMLRSVSFTANPPAVGTGGTEELATVTSDNGAEVSDVWLARLLGDQKMEQRTRYGAAILDEFFYAGKDSPDVWVHQMASWLIPLAAGTDTSRIISKPPAGISDHDAVKVAALIFNYLRVAPLEHDENAEIIRLLFDLPQAFEFDQYALSRAILMRPALLIEVPELRDADIYGPLLDLIGSLGNRDLFKLMENLDPSRVMQPSEEIQEILEEVVRQHSSMRTWMR